MTNYRYIRKGHGYSLVELLIGFTIAIIVLLLLFQVFQSNTDLARTQMDLANMQQSQRVVQHELVRLIRMTGRGGLAQVVDRGNGTRYLPALNVRDNVTSGENIAVGNNGSPIVAEGTDVLAIRGVFNSPVYQLNYANPNTLRLYDANGTQTSTARQAVRGDLTVTDPSPTGIPQDLRHLLDAISNPNNSNNAVPEALIIVSPIDEGIYAVAEITGGFQGANQVTVEFAISNGTQTDSYRTLYNSGLGVNPTFPSGLTSAAYAGIIEEYRFYVREPAANTIPAPALSMARMYPGTEIAHQRENTNYQLDLADNFLDLQIALGYDSDLGTPLADRNGDGVTDEDDIILTETPDGTNDDWLFNSAADDPNAPPFIPPWDRTGVTAPQQPHIYYVRLSTLARVHVPDRNYDAYQIARIENRDVNPLNAPDERRFRRQILQTTVDLRNL